VEFMVGEMKRKKLDTRAPEKGARLASRKEGCLTQRRPANKLTYLSVSRTKVVEMLGLPA
jgi:hypothetical protein